MRDTKQFILDRVEKHPGGCWVWTRYTKPDGYGRTVIGGKSEYAHRLAYTAFIGDIPEGHDVDHKCWNPACCNPDHLQLLPAHENRARQRSAEKSHCINGHKLEGRNLLVRDGGKHRGCRECMNAAVRRYQERKKRETEAA